MPQPLSGPGIGLPIPQNLYPTELNNAPYDAGTNELALNAGCVWVVPAGSWFITPGLVCVIQWLDPITGIWRLHSSDRGQTGRYKSDGFTLRVANLTGCPIAAIVVAGGSSYVAGTTSVTPSTGNSTWQAIVGGQASVTSIAAAGGNYGVSPIVIVSAPPPGGVAATAYATLTSGTVSGVTLSNVGAGYLSAPTAVIVPNPTDPNINSGITQASVVLGLAGGTITGAVTAVLCTNPGAPTASLPTLTVTGAGTGASVNAVTLSTLLSATVTAGAGYTNNQTQLSSFGGQPTGVPAYVNPAIQMTGYKSRPLSANVVAGATTTTIGTIYDSGLFAGTPNAWLPDTGVVTTVATIALATGATNDVIYVQPAP